MDPDVAVWILDFLLRQSSVPDFVLNSLISSLPLPSKDLNLSKAILLRRIETDIAKGTVSEDILDLLELVYANDHEAGVPVTEVMKQAYCWVAVECTLREGGDVTEYFEVVKRVWRERVEVMGERGLFSNELVEWRDMVEAAVWDLTALERLRERWRERDALGAVREYVKEAWEGLGQSFIEEVASDHGAMEALGLWYREGEGDFRDGEIPVEDIVCDGNVVTMPDDVMEVLPSGENEVLRQHSVINNNVDDDNGNKVTMTNDTTMDVLGLREGDETTITPEIRREEITSDEDNVTMIGDETSKVLPSTDNQVLDQTSTIYNVTMTDDTTREVLREGDAASTAPEIKQEEIVDNSNKDTASEMLCSGDNQGSQQTSNLNNVNNVMPQRGTHQPRRKHVAKKRSRKSVAGTSRGAKITDTEQVNQDLSNRYGSLPSPAFVKIQEALRKSAAELQAVVNDPLPEALELAENVISSKNVDTSNPEVQENNGDLERPCTSHQNNAPNPSLMTRNSTAQTCEWDDSIDNLPEGDVEESRSKVNLPTPKNTAVSPLKKHEMKNLRGRRNKKWTLLEEETLRTGVEKYGKGNWKTILNAYPDVFDERTDVDLKDKWRNMTRHCN